MAILFTLRVTHVLRESHRKNFVLLQMSNLGFELTSLSLLINQYSILDYTRLDYGDYVNYRLEEIRGFPFSLWLRNFQFPLVFVWHKMLLLLKEYVPSALQHSLFIIKSRCKAFTKTRE